MTVNLNSKEMLARLLATENISVMHNNVRTASFDVKQRVLTLPVWEEMEEFTYDHFVGHEVGHALFTPTEEWGNQVKSESSSAFQTFLNVIEDARIEKLIQRKYPGLRSSFVKSYRKLFNDGFFGVDAENVSTLQLIDRLNLYFKCGGSFGLKLINENELVWVDEISSAETWEEVVDIAKRLYQKAKEEFEQKQQQQKQEQMQQSDDEEEEQGDDWEDAATDNSDDEDQNDEDDESEDDFTGGEQPVEEDETGEETQIASKTDEALSNNIQKQFNNSNKTVYNVEIDFDVDLSSVLIPWDTVYKQFEFLYNKSYDVKKEIDDTYKKFMLKNKNTINYMVKEFEMKKSAEQYARTSVSPSGVIDTLKMNTYRYNDDIFRKVTIVPDGKNHGLIMFIDWSGSMMNNIGSTVQQLLNLVYFCKKVNIPYRVFSFTTNKTRGGQNLYGGKLNSLSIDSSVEIRELFNSKMNNTKTAFVAKNLLYYTSSLYSVRYLETIFPLRSTPLDQTIILSGKIFKQFKEQTKVDVVNMIFLTDGESDPTTYIHKIEEYTDVVDGSKRDYFDHKTLANTLYNDETSLRLNCKQTKKQYRVALPAINNNETNHIYIARAEVTKYFLKVLQDYTQCNIVGFRIVSSGRKMKEEMSSSNLSDEQYNNFKKDLKKNKFSILESKGYKKYFIIPGGNDLNVSDGSLNVSSDANKSLIKKAFMKTNTDRTVSRVLLNKFVELIA